MSPDERNELVENNLALATYFAKRFRASHMELDDLIQEGRRGLIDAADRFDPARGIKFSTYAAWHIRKSIMEAIRSRNDTVYTPKRHQSKKCFELDPSWDAVDTAPSPHEAMERDEDLHAIRACIGMLPHRDAIVIRLRHGINTEKLTLAKVGDILGVSRERVRQIQNAAEEKLRGLLRDCATLGHHGAIEAEHPKESAHQPESE